jgi:hypothetical protein
VRQGLEETPSQERGDGAPAAVPRDCIVPEAEAVPRRTVDFGLVVGVDHYPWFRSLHGAVADATAFHEWLRHKDGGGLEPQHARLIVSRPHPIAPLQDEVDEDLVAIVKAADAIGGGRRLYFHFSGHGASSPDESREDVALLLAKWSHSLARLALSTDEYRGALGGMGLFEEIVVTLDCCRTATVRAVGLPPMFTIEPVSKRCPTHTFIAYATEAGRSAFETYDRGAWQGVFTRTLLAILRRSSGITAVELKRALEHEVAERGQQAHVINGLRDDSTFGYRGVSPRLVVVFESARGRVRLRNGDRALLAERDAGPGPWELELAAGLYKLEDEGARSILIDHGSEAVTHVRF